MLGQDKLRSELDHYIEYSFPRFSIIVGDRGSGKKEICKYIGERMHAQVVFIDGKVDNIRELIDTAHKVSDTIIYVIADADNMRPNARNATLKLTEEPPRNSYIIMTIMSTSNTLPTLLSRGWVFHMNPYRDAELQKFYGTGDGFSVLRGICTNPQDVLLMKGYSVTEFMKFVDLVVDNIAVVSGSNSFKIANKLKLNSKSADDAYDFRLFLLAFRKVCLDRFREDSARYSYGIQITTKAITSLNVNGRNADMIFDKWLLDIRSGWLDAIN